MQLSFSNQHCLASLWSRLPYKYFRTVRSLLHTLNNLDVDVTLGLIPGHSDIYYNDLVDSKAKTAATDAYNIPTSAELTTQTCKKLISKQCQSAWQQRWDRSEVARLTYDLLPLVGKKLVFPSHRCCSISYVRLLLNDSALKAHRYKTGLVESRMCECGNGIEDSHHFFFEWPRYVYPRYLLERELQLSWEECCNDGNIVFSLQSVLAPYNDSRIVYAARERILAATFNYIRCSGRQLWFFRFRGSATTTIFVISEIIFVLDPQCWQYREIRLISAYTQQCDSSYWINQCWNLVRRDVTRRN